MFFYIGPNKNKKIGLNKDKTYDFTHQAYQSYQIRPTAEPSEPRVQTVWKTQPCKWVWVDTWQIDLGVSALVPL